MLKLSKGGKFLGGLVTLSAHGEQFQAPSMEELVSAVIKYRREYLLPDGNPEQEALAQLKSRHPLYVEGNPDPVIAGQFDYLTDWMRLARTRVRASPVPLFDGNGAPCERCAYRSKFDPKHEHLAIHEQRITGVPREDSLGWCRKYSIAIEIILNCENAPAPLTTATGKTREPANCPASKISRQAGSAECF